MKLDRHQYRAVHAGGSVAVVAGAGTGKTHMLAQRYLHHLRAGGLRPLEVVAVTFTRRAADELRARIRSALLASLAAGDASIAPSAAAELEAAPIGTIHALAQRICHAFPEHAGVPPDVRVLDELEGRLWTAEALDAALEHLRADEVTALPFSLLKTVMRTLLADPFRAERALLKDGGELRTELEGARAAALQAAQDDAWDGAIHTLAGAAGPAEHPAEASRRAAVAAATVLAQAAPDPAAEREAWTVLADLRPHLGRSADWRSLGGGDLAAVKAALRTLRDAARDVWQDGRGPAAWRFEGDDETMIERTAVVRHAFARVRRQLAERKRRAGLVDFADLELHALTALAAGAVREALGRRWRAILVDEYQDTSPAQARLLELLRGTGPVTMVGDEKQAIYGFRGAEVGVFRAERQRLARRAGDSVALDTSYRSHEALVATLNRVFDVVLGDDAAPLRAARTQSTLPGPHVRLLQVSARGVAPEAAASAEARAIAREVRALLHAEPPLEIADGGERRALRAGDVAILARSRASLAALETLAPSLGVPVLNAGGGDVLATREALDGMALLAAVVDPSDAPAVLATVRGPFVAAADPAIHALARARSHGPWWARLDQADDPRLRAGADLLAELRGLHARGTSALELLRHADERCGYAAVLANLPGAARRLADWDGLLALVAHLEAGAADALAVSRRLRRLRAAGVAVPRPPLRSRDAVTLMTIHGAKGLEWPVVIVADLARRGRNQTEDVVVDPDLGVTLRWRDPAGGWTEPGLFRLAETRSRARERAEAARLAYVALTRARDLLVLSARGSTGGLLDVLAAGLEAAGVAPEIVEVEAGAVPPPPPPPAPRDVDDDDRFWARRWGEAVRPPDDTHPSPTSPSPPLPPLDPYAGVPLFDDGGGAVAPSGWRQVLTALAVLDEDDAWPAAAAVVAEAGVPAPHLADVLARVPGPAGTPVEAIARWPRPGGGVALLRSDDLPEGSRRAGGWTYLALDQVAPAAVVPALRAALGGPPGEPSDAADG